MPHEGGTDFAGFFERVAERFSKAPAGSVKLLVISSDMEPHPNPVKVEPLPPLPDVQVVISQWATQRDEGLRWRQYWQTPLTEAYTAGVTWFIHGESLAGIVK